MGDFEATCKVLQKLLRSQKLSYPWILSLNLVGKRERALNMPYTHKNSDSRCEFGCRTLMDTCQEHREKGPDAVVRTLGERQGVCLASLLPDHSRGCVEGRLASLNQEP